MHLRNPVCWREAECINSFVNSNQFAQALKVPLASHAVLGPILNYDDRMIAIHFSTKDMRWGRVTFDRWDSMKVSRGEHNPFPPAQGEEGQFHWVSVITNSVWLRERYDYEKLHYPGKAYCFGGDVDEMLTEFSHYVVEFHDEFVEVLAAGIWFESADAIMLSEELEPSHPLQGLKSAPVSERFETHGITCQVRRSPYSIGELEERAALCSQPILQVGAELDGHFGPGLTLTRRVRNGLGKTFFRSGCGKPVAVFDDIPPLSALRPVFDQWLLDDQWFLELLERRQKMG